MANMWSTTMANMSDRCSTNISNMCSSTIANKSAMGNSPMDIMSTRCSTTMAIMSDMWNSPMERGSVAMGNPYRSPRDAMTVGASAVSRTKVAGG